MPKLLEKHKVLGGRAEIIKYEESPDTWYYREKLPEEKAYRTRKISNVETKLEAEDAAILVYAKLRSEPVKPREEKIKRVSERQDKMEQVQRDQHDRLLLIPERLSAIADAIENLKERIDE